MSQDISYRSPSLPFVFFNRKETLVTSLQVQCFISYARFRPPQNRFSFAMKAASSLILNARQDILSFSRSGKITLTRFRDKVASIARLCGRPFLPCYYQILSNIMLNDDLNLCQCGYLRTFKLYRIPSEDDDFRFVCLVLIFL